MIPPVRRSAAGGRRSGVAFTLVEVLVATLVLGLFLSVAFSTQAGSVVLESRARLEAQAAALVRCKMSEVELALAKDGYPLTDEQDSGPCCEVVEDERFQCSWSISAIELPTVADLQEDAQNRATERTLVATSEEDEQASFQEQTAAFLSMGALGQILPVLQGFLRDSIRKLEVTIVWRYRKVVYDFTVSQYVTNPGQGPLGAFLRQDLVMRLMQGGNAAMFELLFGGQSGAGGPGEAKPGGRP